MTSDAPQAHPPEGPPPAGAGLLRQWQTAAIGLGANQGDREATLLAAWRELTTTPGVRPLRLSSPYLSAPLDMASNHEFLNAVGLVESTIPPFALLRLLLAIEARHGRRRAPQASGYQDRPLDLDLLFCGNLTLQTPELTLPHPRLHERLFVLAPLAEILPDWRHPFLGRTAEGLHKSLVTQGGQDIRRSMWAGTGNGKSKTSTGVFSRCILAGRCRAQYSLDKGEDRLSIL